VVLLGERPPITLQREGERERGREGERERGREGERERGREGEREGGREGWLFLAQ